MNYIFYICSTGCAECGKRSLIKILERASEDDGDEEVVKYKHCCSECSHLIGEHEYKFEVVEQYQEFEMTCMLCGTASDSRSVMPEDPRKAALIF